ADVGHRDDLGDDLVLAAGRIRLASDDGGQRTLAGGGQGHDLVQVAGADRGDTVDLEDGQQDVEDFVLGNPAGGLDRHLLAGHPWSDRVVEAHDLAGRLDHRLDVRIVEVQDDLAATSRR